MKRNRAYEANEPGVDVFKQTGINKKLNNLLGYDEFDKTFEPKKQKSTKRTDVGLDIINEDIDHVPVTGFYLSNTRKEKINYLKNLFNSAEVDRVSDYIINNVYKTVVDSLSDPDKFRDRAKYLKNHPGGGY